jgi:hypothetical protein
VLAAQFHDQPGSSREDGRSGRVDDAGADHDLAWEQLCTMGVQDNPDKPFCRASLKTTERYLGVEKDLTDARCNRLGLEDIRMKQFPL